MVNKRTARLMVSGYRLQRMFAIPEANVVKLTPAVTETLLLLEGMII